MGQKNTTAAGAQSAASGHEAKKDVKILIETSANFVARRLTALPTKRTQFDKLTLRGQVEYLKDCAVKGVIPDMSGDIEIPVKGLFSIDWFIAFTDMIRTLTDTQLLELYGEAFERKDPTSEEKRIVGMYLETGMIVYPNLAASDEETETETETEA